MSTLVILYTVSYADMRIRLKLTSRLSIRHITSSTHEGLLPVAYLMWRNDKHTLVSCLLLNKPLCKCILGICIPMKQMLCSTPYALSANQMKSQNSIRSRVMPSNVSRRVSVAVTDPGKPDMRTAQSLGSPASDPINPCSLPNIACSNSSCAAMTLS